MRILRLVRGTSLTCGCFAGLYETYGGEIVTIIDEAGASCPRPSHTAGRVVGLDEDSPGHTADPATDARAA